VEFCLLPPPRKIWFRRCLFVSNYVQNFQTDLQEIFREGWQWASEQMIKFLAILNRFARWWDLYCNTGMTWLGRGIRCSSASSYVNDFVPSTLICRCLSTICTRCSTSIFRHVRSAVYCSCYLMLFRCPTPSPTVLVRSPNESCGE